MPRSPIVSVIALACLTGGVEAAQPCRLIDADVDGDGAREILLENAYLRIVVEPASGGRLARVEYKSAGVDLTCFGPYRGETAGGLFGDRILGQSYPGDFLEATANVRILENTPARLRVQLTSRGSSGPAANLFVEKELVLEQDRCSLEVRGALAYRTGRLDAETFKTGLWWQHILRLGKTGSQAGWPNTYFVPLTTGILSIPFVPQARNEFTQGNGFLHNPARGWIGCVAASDPLAEPVGAVFTLDYAPLQHYYICMSPSMLEFPTVEWYYQPVRLEDGGSFRTRATVMPFRGLAEITGADGGIVGQLRFGKAQPQVGETMPVRIGLASDRTRQVNVELTDRLLAWTKGQEKTRIVGSQRALLTVDKTAAVEMPLDLKEPGTHVIGVRVLESDGRPVVTFEKPLVVEKSSGHYALEPVVPRVVVDARIKQRENLVGPPTPHVAWARPRRGGPVRALVVSDLGTARQVVELAQRLDMQCDDVLTYGRRLVEKDTPFLFGHRGAATRQHYDVEEHESETERLRRLVTLNRYEVMVVNPDGMDATQIPRDVQELVIQRVRDGMGLVCLNPGPHEPGTGWLDAVSCVVVGPGAGLPHHIHMVGLDESFRRQGIRRTVTPSLVRTDDFASLVPMRLFPPTALYTAERLARCEGRPAIAYDGVPLLVLGQAGAGRVAALNAAMHNLELNTYYEDQTPAMRGERYQEYPYHEYSYLLLARTMLWAARREADLRMLSLDVREATAEGIALAIRIANLTTAPAQVTVEVTLRDRHFRPAGQPPPPVVCPLKPGERPEVRWRWPGPFLAGAHTADVIVRDADGKVADFGSVLIEVSGGARITSAVPHRPLQELGRPAAFHVETAADLPQTVHLDWSLVDTYRRTIQAGTVAADLAPGRNAIPVATGPIQTVSAVLDLELVLRSGQRPMHRHVSYLFVRRPSQVDDAMFEVYGLGGGARSDRSFPFMRALGVDGGGVNYSGYPWNCAFLARKHNLVPLYGVQFLADVGYFGMPQAVRQGPPRTWPDVRPDDPPNIRVWPGIARPGSSSYPMCAHDPTTRQRRREAIRQRAPIARLYSPLDFFIADEAHYQRNVYARTAESTDDLCFCRWCLAAFREYLQQDYGSLEALNAGWGTRYESWEAVMPLPGRQARLLDNWSRWIDFRLFTARSFCASVVEVQEQLRQVDPEARTSGNIHWESPWTAFLGYYVHGPGANRTCEIYPRTFEQGRSYSPEPAWRRIHLGYATYPGHPRSITEHYAWRNLGYGGGRTDFYNGIEGLYGGVLTPTFQVALMGQWLRDLRAAIYETGIGKAILTASPDPPLVGVLESYPSQFAYYLEPQHFDADGYYRRDDYALWHEVKRVWGSYGSLAEDTGLTWRLVNEEECVRAVPAGLRVIVLPRATCLADQTAAVLERFVYDGGVVIADVRLAERDRHGKPHPPGQPTWLGKLFGVRRRPAAVATQPAEAKLQGDESLVLSGAIRSTCHEPGLESDGATAHGRFADGAGHTFLRRLGRGLAVYLNYDLWTYGDDRSPLVRRLFRAILAQAGIGLDWGLVGPDGQPAVNTLCLRRTRGPIGYYFILRNHGGPGADKAELVLPRAAHLYDVAGHRYLGHRARLEVEPSATCARLIAALPYRVSDVSLRLPQEAVQGQSIEVTAVVKTDAAPAGDHVLRMEVTGPDGSPCAYWSGNVLTAAGRYADTWTLALDEAVGRWRVGVLDVLGGQRATAEVQVRARSK